MTITTEPVSELETKARRYRITSDQAATLRDEGTPPEGSGPEEVTITWQRCTGRVPSVLVTVPAGPDGWAVPIPYRPDWLAARITNDAPKWWLA